MFNLLQLQQQRAHKQLLANELIDNSEKAEGGPRPLSTEELGLFDKLESEIKSLDDQILAVQAHEIRRAKAVAMKEKLEGSSGRQSAPDQPGSDGSGSNILTSHANFRIPATARRTGVLKAFKPRNGESVHTVETRAYRAGMWARATLFKDERAQNWCLSNGMAFDIRGAMGTNSNTDGGFFNVEATNDTNRVDLFVFGNDERMLVVGRLDNLGKGASGAAVQAMNVHLGVEESLGLV